MFLIVYCSDDWNLSKETKGIRMVLFFHSDFTVSPAGLKGLCNVGKQTVVTK